MSPDVENLLGSLWDQRFEGLPVSGLDIKQPIRHSDLEYLLNRYPYVQLVKPDPTPEDELEVLLVRTKTGWVIHDFGDAFSVSPGDWLFGPRDAAIWQALIQNETGDRGDEGAGGAILAPGSGTIIKQQFDVAYELIFLAMKRGWKTGIIVSGTPLMNWATWMASKDMGFSLEGYAPNQDERAKRKRIEKQRAAKRKMEKKPS